MLFVCWFSCVFKGCALKCMIMAAVYLESCGFAGRARVCTALVLFLNVHAIRSSDESFYI